MGLNLQEQGSFEEGRLYNVNVATTKENIFSKSLQFGLKGQN